MPEPAALALPPVFAARGAPGWLRHRSQKPHRSGCPASAAAAGHIEPRASRDWLAARTRAASAAARGPAPRTDSIVCRHRDHARSVGERGARPVLVVGIGAGRSGAGLRAYLPAFRSAKPGRHRARGSTSHPGRTRQFSASRCGTSPPRPRSPSSFFSRVRTTRRATWGFLIPYFVSQGMAVLTFDQRGTGLSSGDWRAIGPMRKRMM
jgi:hypothetical protein